MSPTDPTDDRPTVRGTGARQLTDAEAPDFLESARVAVLAFVDASVPASAKLQERFERIAPLFAGEAAFGVLDVRHSPLVADALGVRRVPEILVFVGGASVDRLAGVPPEDVIVSMVRERLAHARGA